MRVLVLFIGLLICCSATAQSRYVIEGKFNTDLLGDDNEFSIRDGDLIYLNFSRFNKSKKLGRTDTAVVKNKMFRFEGELESPMNGMVNVSLQSYGLGPAFGNSVYLDDCHYEINYTQVADEQKRVRYDVDITTNSVFYKLMMSLFGEKGVYLKKKRELMDMLEDAPNEQIRQLYQKELSAAKQRMDNAYLKGAKEYAGTYEMTYILPSYPYFGNDRRFKDFYEDLPDVIKNSDYGERYIWLLLNKPDES